MLKHKLYFEIKVINDELPSPKFYNYCHFNNRYAIISDVLSVVWAAHLTDPVHISDYQETEIVVISYAWLDDELQELPLTKHVTLLSADPQTELNDFIYEYRSLHLIFCISANEELFLQNII